GEETAPVNPAESMMLPATDPVVSHETLPGDAAAAGVMNVVYIPGKAIICTAGTVTATVLLILTFGSAYRSARDLFLEGCSSPWALTADHVSGKIPGPGDPGYDSGSRYKRSHASPQPRPSHWGVACPCLVDVGHSPLGRPRPLHSPCPELRRRHLGTWRDIYPGRGLYRVTGIYEARAGDTLMLVNHDAAP